MTAPVTPEEARGLLGVPAGPAPLCLGCLDELVAVPGAGVFGDFGEDCIKACHEGQENSPAHSCPVCAASEPATANGERDGRT